MHANILGRCLPRHQGLASGSGVANTVIGNLTHIARGEDFWSEVNATLWLDLDRALGRKLSVPASTSQLPTSYLYRLYTAQKPPAIMLSDAAPPALAPIVTTGAAKPEGQAVAEYGIVSAYQRVLADDPDVTMPVAAIEALISVLGQTTSSTVMETLDIIRTEAERLKASVPNPVPLAAGTDLFQQYLLRSLKKQDGSSSSSSSSNKKAAGATAAQTAAASTATDGFEETRQYLIRNSRLFASRAKQARAAIADRGARIITEGKVVLTGGGSRTVAAILLRAAELHTAEHGSPRFRVVYVVDPRFSSPAPAPATTDPSSPPQKSQPQPQSQQQQQQQPSSVAAALRARGVPVAEVAEREVAHVLRTAGVDLAVLGAEVLCQNGGILSRIGTFNIAELVRAYGKSVYVAAESHKIARVYPLSQMDLPRCGVQQQVARFTTAADADAPEPPKPADADPVDYTPPQMITKFITEYGTKTPSDIYEMLLDIFYS
ncbi:hypothetical protein RB601_003525 [Gaeumannomyces tritici]